MWNNKKTIEQFNDPFIVIIMATPAELQALVNELTKELMDKAEFEKKIRSSLDSIDLCISEFADQRIPR